MDGVTGGQPVSSLKDTTPPSPKRDLVDRLRAGCTDWDGSPMADETPPMDCITAGDVREAATTIEALRAEVAELAQQRGALAARVLELEQALREARGE